MHLQRVAQKLMEIKAVFPEADAANVFLQWPVYFLATDAHAMEANVARLQSILPDVNIQRWYLSLSRIGCSSLAFSSACHPKEVDPRLPGRAACILESTSKLRPTTLTACQWCCHALKDAGAGAE